jgi:hypothetical protein
MDREVFSDLLFVGVSNVAATHYSPHNPTDAKGYRVASSLAALLGAEDYDLIEGEDAEAEGDPEVEKALCELRTLVAQVSELRASGSREGMVHKEIL